MSEDLTELCRYAAEKIEGWEYRDGYEGLAWYSKGGCRPHSSPPNYPDPDGSGSLARLRSKTLEQEWCAGISLLKSRVESTFGKIIGRVETAGYQAEYHKGVADTPAEAEFRAIVAAWKAQEGK